MKRAGRLAVLVAGALIACTPAFAGTRKVVLDIYSTFAEAQNARDPARIGAFSIDGPDFLCVSDGQTLWGREAAFARMSNFQKAAVRRVTPDLDPALLTATQKGVAP